jgi:hypothetical protein
VAGFFKQENVLLIGGFLWQEKVHPRKNGTGRVKSGGSEIKR